METQDLENIEYASKETLEKTPRKKRKISRRTKIIAGLAGLLALTGLTATNRDLHIKFRGLTHAEKLEDKIPLWYFRKYDQRINLEAQTKNIEYYVNIDFGKPLGQKIKFGSRNKDLAWRVLIFDRGQDYFEILNTYP